MIQEASSTAVGNWTEEEKEVRLEELNQETFSILLPSVALCGILMTIGIPGNILVFFVYLTEFRPSTTRVFIMAMSLCDLCTNIISIPFLIYRLRYMYKSSGMSSCVFFRTASHFPVTMSNCLLVCMAFDRWRRVCIPYEWQLNTRSAGQLLVVSFIVSSTLVLPLAVLYGEKKFILNNAGLQATTCDFPSAYNKCVFGSVMLVYMMILLDLMAYAYGSIIARFYQQDKMFLKIHRLTASQSTGISHRWTKKAYQKRMSQDKKLSDTDDIQNRCEESETQWKSSYREVRPYAVTSRSITNISPSSSVCSSNQPDVTTSSFSQWFALVDNLQLEKRDVNMETSPNVPSFEPQVLRTRSSCNFTSNDHILTPHSTANTRPLSSTNSSTTIKCPRQGKSLWKRVTSKPVSSLIETASEANSQPVTVSFPVDNTNTLVSSTADNTDKIFEPNKSTQITTAPLLATRESVSSPGHDVGHKKMSMTLSKNSVPSEVIHNHKFDSFDQPGSVSSTQTSPKGSANLSSTRVQTLETPSTRRDLLPSTTLMMLMMTTISIIFYIPYTIMTIRNIDYPGANLSDLKLNLVALARLFVYTNSVINILIYSVCNDNFRCACRKFLKRILD